MVMPMKRETTNAIRYVLEELLPPAFRDSRFMRWLFRGYWGRLVCDLEDFRARAHHVGEQEYVDIYAALPRIHEGFDSSEACIQRIIESTGDGDVLDVGCGTGLLLKRIRSGHACRRRYTLGHADHPLRRSHGRAVAV
jgi:SAM-dependent methyltransferase